jgi:hypothetical protein
MEITTYLTDCVKQKIPVAFAKYGDGEQLAASGINGCNCDRDPYTDKLKNGIIDSFKYMVDHAQNSYIAIWPFNDAIEYWKQFVEKPIRNVDYCAIIMAGEKNEKKIDLLKAIKESQLKKIYICNPLMKRAKILLNIDHMIHVPLNNWVDSELENILDTIKSIITANEQFIILTSAGMGAKILISELCKLFPNNIYLDVGSALDQICTKKKSRGYEPSYEQAIENLKDIIPEDWDSPEYNYIYNEAYYNIGYHVSS